MNGLHALKPWYADRLSGVRRALAARRVPPGALTAAGVGCAAGAGAALAFLPAPLAALPVAVLLAARLACAHLAGALACDTGRTTRRGAVLNELGDRAADLLVVAGFLPPAPLWLVATAAFAATLPSWVSLAGAAAGAPRRSGGPVGRTERCLLAIVAAASGLAVPVLAVMAAGSAVTALIRLGWVWRRLGQAQAQGRKLGQGQRQRQAQTQRQAQGARESVVRVEPVASPAKPPAPAPLPRRRPFATLNSPTSPSPQADRRPCLDPGEVSGGITHARAQSSVDQGARGRGAR
ncbi:phosphatidate cytidylyltransferase [Streptomyces sp. NPDC058067]|uniref:phosphatidate cytidylyltransferase n=1 Tax=Streptomyces sp. NPDC058067 TaxID=3346324 RepID=UPI0036F0259D